MHAVETRVKSESNLPLSPANSPETSFGKNQSETENWLIDASHRDNPRSEVQVTPIMLNRGVGDDVPRVVGRGGGGGPGSTREETGLTGTDKPRRINRKWRSTCGKCGKQFVSTSAFDKHILVHNEKRPYHCAICDIGFKLKVGFNFVLFPCTVLIHLLLVYV